MVFEQGELIVNSDKFRAFTRNLTNEKEDKICIVPRTTEGDPIFDTLDYNGDNVAHTYNNSHNEVGGSISEHKIGEYDGLATT
ncbi:MULTISPECIES: DUF4362 domain-containing protein [Planococcus]|uniref:Uncharacterized protein n=1 Tax=Planococcus faecalis TaxID=1598147 RepID=A0ABN4XPM5_9BACL|nr:MULTISPECIES: DUF4362 domain-containing protein [Planococcus]AQU80751.1 hypothetical protein AJGP001_16285 [Planococcus faecalis]MDJ0331967.1 DUF4362 domain-containing protein [Planococcus sp. S3-L1]OHX55742.1 hypothetical protein BB777_00860 [Planococcus faecalis]